REFSVIGNTNSHTSPYNTLTHTYTHTHTCDTLHTHTPHSLTHSHTCDTLHTHTHTHSHTCNTLHTQKHRDKEETLLLYRETTQSSVVPWHRTTLAGREPDNDATNYTQPLSPIRLSA